MTTIRTLLMAAAVTTSMTLAMPVAGQAMPQSVPVKMQTAKDGNIVAVHYKKKKWRKYKYSRKWRHRHRHARYYRYWDEPYYGYGYPYPYYYGGWGPGFYGPGIGFHFRID